MRSSSCVPFSSVQPRDGREVPRTLVVAPPDRDGHAELTPEGAGDDVESDFRAHPPAGGLDRYPRLPCSASTSCSRSSSLGEGGEHTRELARHGRERAGSILDGVPPCLDLEDPQRGLPADQGEERDPQIRRPRQIEVRVRPRLESHAPGGRLRRGRVERPHPHARRCEAGRRRRVSRSVPLSPARRSRGSIRWRRQRLRRRGAPKPARRKGFQRRSAQ